VIGVTHLLLQDNPREDQLENLNTLKFSAENLLVIINDILDYNKIESAKVEFESNDIHIKNLACSIKSSFAFKAEEKGIRLKVKIDEDLPEFVRGDSTRLAQVLTNLVGNAIKFTEQGSVILDIEVQEESDERVGLRFMIKDSGIGIPSNKLDVIFDRFGQASASTTRRHGGTGLGLAICQGLLELQDSRLQVESEQGKGSTFWFDLSFLRSGRVMTSTSNSGPTFINSMPSFAGLQGTRVLLVEDNMLNVAVTRQFLRKWQVEMVHAENGVEALKVLENDLNFHVVLMDLQMPEMDGYECSRRMRENDKTSHLPIIALTASAMPEVVIEVKQKGMNDFVTKPFHPADLYMKIRNCLLKQAS
jgi:CheY-like chemotaxis protein